MDLLTFLSVDITTLAVTRGFVQMMLGGLLLYLGVHHDDAKDAKWWALGFFLNGISLFIFPIQVSSYWQSVITFINHLTLGASAVFFLLGFWKFGHQPVRIEILLALIAFPVISLFLWEVMWPNGRYRILLTALGQVVYLLLLQHSLSRPPREEMRRLYYRLRLAVVAYTLIYIWSYISITQLLPTTGSLTVDYHRALFSMASLLFMLTLAVGCLALQYVLLATRNADLALQDWLTGLLNRRGLFQAIANDREQFPEKKSNLSVLAIDIDLFKHINDQYGHSMGDVVLQRFSQSLLSFAGTDRIIARTGGEEFLILSNEESKQQIAELAEAIRLQTEQLNITTPEGQSISFTVSIGIYHALPDENMDQIFVKADKALYLAKERGRNQTASFSDHAITSMKDHLHA